MDLFIKIFSKNKNIPSIVMEISNRYEGVLAKKNAIYFLKKSATVC